MPAAPYNGPEKLDTATPLGSKDGIELQQQQQRHRQDSMDETLLPHAPILRVDAENVDTSPQDMRLPSLRDEGSTSSLDIILSNAYGISPKGYYPWLYLAEPYRDSFFQVTLRGRGDSTAKGSAKAAAVTSSTEPTTVDDYRWIVDGHFQGYGSSIEVHFTELGQHKVKVEAMSSAGDILEETTIPVQVKYVRREIRQLLDADREALFNAYAVLQRVPTRVGQRLYGPKYLSKDYLVRLHLYYGGMRGCDHWHQGPGFVTSHMAYTLLFEQSLQAVNPVVSLPFWDFTLESTFYEPHSWRQSPIFARDWFGDASPPNDLHTVVAGRLAYTPTMVNAREFSQVHNSYGLLRAPWNNDPSPFVTRSEMIYGIPNNMKPSGCSEYARVLKSENWADFSRQLNSAAHGHIHETVGGSWNHAFGDDMGQTTPASVLTFAHMIQALSKDVWRSGYLVCPDSCSLDTPWEDCRCECPGSKREGLSDYEVLRRSGVLAATSYFDAEKRIIETFVDPEDGEVHYSLQGGNEEEIYSNLLRYVCDPGHIGTMFQASSSNDPLFWVLHPTIDRVWHLKRLTDENFDDDWPHDSAACYGHNSADVQPIKRGLFGEASTEEVADSSRSSDTRGRGGSNFSKGRPVDKYYTNAELYELLHPANEALPYVYANFDWPHCEQLGYRMAPSTTLV